MPDQQIHQVGHQHCPEQAVNEATLLLKQERAGLYPMNLEGRNEQGRRNAAGNSDSQQRDKVGAHYSAVRRFRRSDTLKVSLAE